jgi:hypothetical protein
MNVVIRTWTWSSLAVFAMGGALFTSPAGAQKGAERPAAGERPAPNERPTPSGERPAPSGERRPAAAGKAEEAARGEAARPSPAERGAAERAERPAAGERASERGLERRPTDRIERRGAAIAPEQAIAAYREAQRELRDAERRQRDAQAGGLEKAPENANEAAQDAIAAARAKIAEARRDLQDARRSAPRLSAEEKERAERKLAERDRKRRVDGEDRAKATREKLASEHGEAVSRPEIQSELRRHAWRVARLERLIAMGEAADRLVVAERAKSLLDKENELHQRRLATLSGKTEDEGGEE